MIAGRLNPNPVILIFFRISHKFFFVPFGVKVSHAGIFVVIDHFPWTIPPRINVYPYLLLLALLLILLLIVRHRLRSLVLNFEGAWEWNHDYSETSTHHDCVISEVGVQLILTV